MQCPRCMNEVADTAKFCTKCAFNIQSYRANVMGEAIAHNASTSAAAVKKAHAAGPKRGFITDAFLYPLTGTGPYIIVGGILMLFVGDILFFFNIFTYGYLILYYFNIIRSTSNKKDQPPDWPELFDIFEVLHALLMFAVNISFAYVLPMIIYYAAIPDTTTSSSQFIRIGIFTWLCIYLPMATIIAAQTSNLIALNPFTVLLFISKAPPRYYLVCLLYFVAAIPYILSALFSQETGGFLFNLVMHFLFLDTILVTARMLGLFCKEILPD